MIVSMMKADGQVLEIETDSGDDTVMMLKILIGSKDDSLGASPRLFFEGSELTDEEATLTAVQYWEGAKMYVVAAGEEVPLSALQPPAGVTSMGGKGKGKGRGVPLQGRKGDAPASGFQAVQIVVSGVSNEKTNGVYLPAPPHNEKPCWYKAASSEEPAEGDSKDDGERGIYYAPRQEKWFIGDELDSGGFAFAQSWGQCVIPPSTGWAGGASIKFQGEAADGDVNGSAGLTELTNLSNVEPWADQETCYNTMLKVLNNIATNPGEAKFFSLKVDNAAIQNRILKHNGARGFLEAIGFREKDGALTLPQDRHSQAAVARDMLQGFATEASYRNIQKERHAKAAEETKKEAVKPKRWAPPAGGGDEGGGSRFGKDRGMRGGGG